ncbi:MAG: TolC family protein [Desulfobacterales bacterium]|nr:TolC family protein [Desulfobacterales bacterium]
MKKACNLAAPIMMVLLFFSPAHLHSKELIALLPNLLNTHELIRAQEQRRDRAMFLLRAAQGGYYPKLDVVANAGPEWINKIEDEDTSLTRNYEKASVNQLITDFGNTTGRIDQSKLVLEIEKENLNSIRQDVLLNGITSYLGLIRADKTLGFARQSEENIRTQTGMEETMVEYGAGLSSDVLQAKSQLSSAKARVASTVGELGFANNRFRAVFGFGGRDMVETFNIPPSPEVKLPNTVNEAVAIAWETNPRLVVARLEIDRLGQEERVNKSRYFPELSAFAEGVRREDYLGFEGVREEAVIGAELTYNLYNGGSDKARVEASIKEINEARDRYAETRKLVEEEVGNAWQELETARERFIYLRDQAVIVGEFLEFARQERKLGKRSLLDVLAGEADHLNAQANAVAAGIDIEVATYRLFRAMGKLDIDLLVH